MVIVIAYGVDLGMSDSDVKAGGPNTTYKKTVPCIIQE